MAQEFLLDMSFEAKLVVNPATIQKVLNENLRQIEMAFDDVLSISNPQMLQEDLDMGGNRITNVAVPIEDEDAVRLIDLRQVSKMEGPQGLKGDKGDSGQDGKDGESGPKGDPGLDGKDGIDGKNGLQGLKGDKGDTGLPGIDGRDGLNGIDGLDGKTVLNGKTNPTNNIGNVGDFYINTAANTIFGPKTDVWGKGTDLVGPQGPAAYHESLPGLQGGKQDEHYHLTADQYRELSMPYALQYDQDADPPSFAYLGQAVPGSSTAISVWRIQKLVFAAGGDVISTWADGNANFDNVWDDRTSLTYS